MSFNEIKKKKERKKHHQLVILEDEDLREKSVALVTGDNNAFIKFLKTLLKSKVSEKVWNQCDPNGTGKIETKKFRYFFFAPVKLFKIRIHERKYGNKTVPTLDKKDLIPEFCHLATWIIRRYGEKQQDGGATFVLTKENYAKNIIDYVESYADAGGELFEEVYKENVKVEIQNEFASLDVHQRELYKDAINAINKAQNENKELNDRTNCKDVCCEWSKCIYCFCYLGYEIYFIILFIGFFIGKDIACIIINDQNQCNHSIDGINKYVSFDLNTWIIYGCSIHLIVSILFLCIAICCLVPARNNECEDDWFDALPGIKGVTFICMILPWCFFVSWMVIGFLFHSEMSNDDKQCKNVVLSWCILQAIETVVAPLMACMWFVCMLLSTNEE